MTVPSPSIRPLRIAGGEHALLYVGALNVSSDSSPGEFAQGIASFLSNPDATPYSTITVGTELIGTADRRYHVTQVAHMSGFELVNVVANAQGAEYNLPVGALLTLATPQPYFPSPGNVEEAITGGAAPVVASGVLNIDLTDMSPFLRDSASFVEQLHLTIKALDLGLGNVNPYILREVDFHRDASGRIEYVTVEIESDSDANEAVVKVVLPHTHSR